MVLQALQGPLDVCAGLTAGALFGLLAALTPHLEDVRIPNLLNTNIKIYFKLPPMSEGKIQTKDYTYLLGTL